MPEPIDNMAPGAQPDAGPPPDAPPGLSMPAAVKDGLSQGLAAIIDQIAKVAEAIQGARADDSAEIPTEPLFALDEAAASLDALADQWIMEEEAGEPPPAAGDAPAQKMAPALKAKVKADEMPRRKMRLIAKKRHGALKAIHSAMGEAHKALGSCHKDFDGVLKELAGEAAPPPKDEPKQKSVSEEVSEAIAPLLSKVLGVETSLASLMTTAKSISAAPAQLPNGGHEDGAPPPAAHGGKSYKQMLAEAQKK